VHLTWVDRTRREIDTIGGKVEDWEIEDAIGDEKINEDGNGNGDAIGVDEYGVDRRGADTCYVGDGEGVDEYDAVV
jgi:hypothetical protein